MKKGRVIALSALTTAFGVIFLVFGAYFSTFDLSCLFMATVMMMLPLSKGYVKGALLSYLATLVLSVFLVAGKFYLPILFGVFFGLYPIVNYYQLKTNKTLSYITIIKLVWFVLTLLLMVFLFEIFVITNPIISKYLIYIVIFGGALIFIPLDLIMLRFQKMTRALIERLKL